MGRDTGLVVQQLLVGAAGCFLFLYEPADLLLRELGLLAIPLVVGLAAATAAWQYRSDRDAHGGRVAALQDRPFAVVGILAVLAAPLLGLAVWRLSLGTAAFFAVVGGLALGLGANRLVFGVVRPVPEGALPPDAESAG